MELSPSTPDPTGRRSSEVKPRPADAKPGSSVAEILPAADPSDNSPTVISANRPQITSAEAVAQSLQGKQLGHFELQGLIAVGGMARVIQARDLQLGRTVALKILPPEMAVDPENIQRFKQEARLAAQLDHENIARVYFCGEDQGLHFIAFEYVKGVDLRTMLEKNGPLAPGQAVKYMLQVATGLAHAAERGVTHRDIKPSNILVTPEGRAKIVDMGLARTTGVHGAVTQSGVTLGTFDYISPEQALEPRAADVRSDIYSLGCTFYHLLTGVPPVPEGTAAKKLHHHQNLAPEDPRRFNPSIPDELVAILGKMMAKDPRDRYQRPEELIQHLIAVAQKMNLPGETGSQERVLFVDALMPSPSRLSPVLLAVAAIAAVVLLAVVLGLGGGSGDAPPLVSAWAWRSNDTSPTPPVPPAPAIANDPPRPIAAEPKQAATIEQLARLLEQNVEQIILTGDEYDLADLVKDDARPPARNLTATRGVKLIGKGSVKGQRPVLRWRIEGGPPMPAGAAQAMLTLSGGASVQSELHNLRFEVRESDSDTPVYAVAARGLGRLSVVDCEFLHEGKAESPYGGSVQFDGSGAVELERCWFASGSKALDLSKGAMVRAKDCAFGPHDVLFLFQEKTTAAASAERILAELNHCSVMMKAGTIFDVERNVSGTIRAGNCVFARGSGTSEVVLVRQSDPQQQIAVTGPAGGARGRNAYYGLVYWMVEPAHAKANSPDECRKSNMAFRDADAADLPRDRSPWQNAQPLQMLDNPAEAFALNLTRHELRTLPQEDALIGVQSAAWGKKLYSDTLPVAQDDPPEVPANVRIVDSTQDTDGRKRIYGTLADALAESKNGEFTILIRSTEPLELPPLVLGRSKVTIRPEGTHRPVLTLAETDVPNAAMFLVHNSSLTLKGLHFRLKPAVNDDSKGVSVVTIAGAGQCHIEDCVATLDTNDDTVPSLVAVTVDPELAAKLAQKSLPKIRLKDCIIRGPEPSRNGQETRANVVSVRGSRPIDLEAENVLAALNGSFLTITGQPKEPPLSPTSQIVCKHVTAFLSEPFLDLRGGELDKKTIGLAPTQVRAEDCLFASASERPLVYATGVDRDSLTTKNLLTWEGVHNLYANYGKYLDVKPGGAMMMTTDWSAKDWLQFTRENDDSSGQVVFARSATDDRPLTKVVPNDFRARVFGMKKENVNATEYGATLSQLPKIEDE
jgi:serine/threonine protein kinase